MHANEPHDPKLQFGNHPRGFSCGPRRAPSLLVLFIRSHLKRQISFPYADFEALSKGLLCDALGHRIRRVPGHGTRLWRGGSGASRGSIVLVDRYPRVAIGWSVGRSDSRTFFFSLFFSKKIPTDRCNLHTHSNNYHHYHIMSYD